jgi:hypothetical protein
VFGGYDLLSPLVQPQQTEASMLNVLKTLGMAIGLAFVVIAFSGVKYIGPECNPTGVLGDGLTCDSNIDLNR